MNPKHILFVLLILSGCTQLQNNVMDDVAYKNQLAFDAHVENLIDENYRPPDIEIDSLEENQHYCYIDSVFEKDGKLYLSVDFIDILTGQKAIDAHEKASKLREGISSGYSFIAHSDTLIAVTERDSCSWRENWKCSSQVLLLHPKAELLFWSFDVKKGWKKQTAAKELKDEFCNKSHYFLIETSGSSSDIIIKLKEQFL